MGGRPFSSSFISHQPPLQPSILEIPVIQPPLFPLHAVSTRAPGSGKGPQYWLGPASLFPLWSSHHLVDPSQPSRPIPPCRIPLTSRVHRQHILAGSLSTVPLIALSPPQAVSVRTVPQLRKGLPLALSQSPSVSHRARAPIVSCDNESQSDYVLFSNYRTMDRKNQRFCGLRK